MLNVWTDDRIDLASKLWREGLTAQQIASLLEVSRNSVCGKLKRLGLSSADKAETAPTTRDAYRAPRLRKDVAPVGSTAYKVIHSIKRRQKQAKLDESKFACRAVPGIDPQNVSLMDLAKDGCRWPTTEHLPHLFCNLRQRENSSYCHAHFLRSVGEGTLSERSADKLPKMVA